MHEIGYHQRAPQQMSCASFAFDSWLQILAVTLSMAKESFRWRRIRHWMMNGLMVQPGPAAFRGPSSAPDQTPMKQNSHLAQEVGGAAEPVSLSIYFNDDEQVYSMINTVLYFNSCVLTHAQLCKVPCPWVRSFETLERDYPDG